MTSADLSGSARSGSLVGLVFRLCPILALFAGLLVAAGFVAAATLDVGTRHVLFRSVRGDGGGLLVGLRRTSTLAGTELQVSLARQGAQSRPAVGNARGNSFELTPLDRGEWLGGAYGWESSSALLTIDQRKGDRLLLWQSVRLALVLLLVALPAACLLPLALPLAAARSARRWWADLLRLHRFAPRRRGFEPTVDARGDCADRSQPRIP